MCRRRHECWYFHDVGPDLTFCLRCAIEPQHSSHLSSSCLSLVLSLRLFLLLIFPDVDILMLLLFPVPVVPVKKSCYVEKNKKNLQNKKKICSCWLLFPTAPVPTAPVPTTPVPTAPVPTAPVPAPVPTAPVPTLLLFEDEWI
jgi:hypothetical protein